MDGSKTEEGLIVLQACACASGWLGFRHGTYTAPARLEGSKMHHSKGMGEVKQEMRRGSVLLPVVFFRDFKGCHESDVP